MVLKALKTKTLRQGGGGTLSGIFNIRNEYQGDKKFKKIKFLGCSIPIYFYCGRKSIHTFWEKIFKEYFKNNNIAKKVKHLKEGLDDISCEYIDKFMEIVPYWNKYIHGTKNGWTDYDLALMEKYSKEEFQQPFGYITKFNPFIFQNKYGLIDLHSEVLEQINGKDIVDAGGLNGDTAVMFAEYFPNSKIYVYEPLIENIKTLNVIIREGNYRNRIIPVQKGLGNECGVVDFKFNYENKAEIVPLDIDYKGNNLGLIKMDTEGFETQITEGAAELIKRYKPVLAIAIYHTPEDFFELKDKIIALNPDYKFMIRRSEQVIPTADLVLIAY